MLFLNRGVGRGAVSVVVPISAVTGIALSVICGVVIVGDRPTTPAWIGILVVGPALWAISGGTIRGISPAVTDGLIASCGVAVQYLALAQTGTGSGLWPVATGRAAAVIVIAIPFLRAHEARRRATIGRADIVRAGAIGAGAAVGLVSTCWRLNNNCSQSRWCWHLSTPRCPCSSVPPPSTKS